MKIEIDGDEINEAIVAYVNTLGIDTEGKLVTVILIPGRKHGNSAEIEIKAMPTTQVDPPNNIVDIEQKDKMPFSETGEEKIAEEDDSLFTS